MRYVDTVLGHGPRLNDWLREGLARAESAALRTGFLTAPAIDDIKPALTAFLARDRHLLIVAGGAPDQADPDALIQLGELLRPYQRAALRVVVHPDEFQNAKTYHLAFPDGHGEALIGSPNFTWGGMDSNHEAAVLLDSREPGEADAVAAVLAGTEAFRDRTGSTPVSEDTRLLLAGRQATVARRGGRRARQLRAPRTLEELLQPAMDRIDAAASDQTPLARGLQTGYDDLDTVVGELPAGSLTVIAGRPGVGRTGLLLGIVRHAAIRNGLRSALFSLDATHEDVVQQLVSAETRVRHTDMRRGRLTDEDWTRIARGMTEISDAPLVLNATPAPDLNALCTQITDLAQNEPLYLVGIDPVNMIDAGLDRSASREREISRIARRLKILALELGVPIVVTAELGRTVETRYDKRPELGDMRDSDTLNQVADIVLLMHRPTDIARMGEVDVMIAKQRNGDRATVVLAHQPSYGRLASLVGSEITWWPWA